jgi:hypothetical protein
MIYPHSHTIINPSKMATIASAASKNFLLTSKLSVAMNCVMNAESQV